ncbi:MAG: Maf-like protein [Proteobacteria bacterium]|nr:Maf-like protein [Pseudomonadota bacterium]
MALVLASKSASRRMMLDAAGVAYRCQPADIDERAVEAGLGAAEPGAVALALAEAKAGAVVAPGDLVLGSDSLVICHGRRFDKPASRADAAAHLRWFSGRTMELHSAAALLRDGAVVWRHADCARLVVRELSDAFIDQYLDAEWPEVGHCVGVFRIEGRGAHLFERIEGSQFTVLGMPLLPLLGGLRQLGELTS